MIVLLDFFPEILMVFCFLNFSLICPYHISSSFELFLTCRILVKVLKVLKDIFLKMKREK